MNVVIICAIYTLSLFEHFRIIVLLIPSIVFLDAFYFAYRI